ncbi:MAG: MFS transporter [Sphingomonadales bacterium]
MAEGSTTVSDPRALLARAPMRGRQILVIAICVALNALDGFDVLSISFASPGIAAEWGIDRAALGIVLSMELIGMAFGAMILGHAADRIGRRPTALLCLMVMAGGMYATTLAANVTVLAVLRLLTGLGIGGMLACTNAMTAEFANDRWRGAAVAIMAAGYPLGAIIGGSVVTGLLETGGWRDIFSFGALVTAAFIPVVYLLVPETVGFTVQKQPADALARVNRALAALGHPPVDALPPPPPTQPKAGFAALLAPGMARITLLLTVAYFFHIMTLYFVLKWVPKLVVDMGFHPAQASGVLVWANVGGLTGSLLLSLLALRIGLRPLVMAAMLLSAAMVGYFGAGHDSLLTLSLAAAAAGFCTNAGVVGSYALIAASFPTAMRAGGTGFVIGFGRGGAALGPIAAGFLFEAGFGLGIVALIMGAGSLVAVLALIGLPPPKSQPHL